MKKVELNFHSSNITIETGRIAKQASGAVLVTSGESMVLVTACLGADKDFDFLPLTVDYVEKFYAAGKIPGGFFRREGKLSDREVLTSRLIDRPIRPLFPEGFSNEVQVVATVLSSSPDALTDVLAVCGASAALTVSEIPFQGPVAAVRVCRVKGKLLINPNLEQTIGAELNFVVVGSKEAIVMVEGGAQEVPEKEVMDALFYAHTELQHLIKMQEDLQKVAGKTKITNAKPAADADLVKKLVEFYTPKLKPCFKMVNKLERRDALSKAKEEATALFVKADDKDAAKVAKLVNKVFEDTSFKLMRDMILDEKVRIDGRDFHTVRPISIEAGFLPRAHGSALFQRGETQAIVVTTLGTQQEAQIIDALNAEEDSKKFMLHYNFPPFSVGEAKPMRGPGRREVGHGNLAERALKAVMPDYEKFPYVVRIVSETTESNGSSSMAAVCGGALSLMDAGVPIVAPVAGVAMGLIKEGSKYAILTDILGDEDHLGDMDFKVCGTERGVTSLQMDIKICGLDRNIMTEAMEQARLGRLHILKQMGITLAASRPQLSKYAPKVVTLRISVERIKDLIGPGGKTIKSIIESCNVKIDVEKDGTVNIFAVDAEMAKAAETIVRSLTEEAEVGRIYKGLVKRITEYGAFVEIFPGTDGLLHISQIAHEPVRRVTDVMHEGDEVMVKVLEVDPTGKIRLSRKEAMADAAQHKAN